MVHLCKLLTATRRTIPAKENSSGICNLSKRKAYCLCLQPELCTFGHMKQMAMLKPESKSYGSTLRNRRKGRGTRPLSTKDSMHLVLRSSKAKGDWSFKRKENESKINSILARFSKRYYVQIISCANVGNHLHLHIQLIKRSTYKPFIRAITAAIAMAVTGASRWKKLGIQFWDYRPFTRVVQGLKALTSIREYIAINQLEGLGYGRIEAKFLLASNSC